MKPIRPNEVVALKQTQIPDEMIRAVNELIAENMSNGSATIKQNDIVSKFLSLRKENNKDHLRGEVFKKGGLNIEDIYRSHGWKVTYDKPAYNEEYEPYFVFTPKTIKK